MIEYDLRRLAGNRVLAGGLFFPESPRWRDGILYFCDGSLLRAVSPATDLRDVARLPAQVCLGLAAEEGGSFLVAATRERHIYRVEPGGNVSLLHDLSGHVSAGINEITLLPDGSLLVGCMGFSPLHGDTPRAVPLLHVSPRGEVRSVGPSLLFANGMALDEAAETLFVVETFGRRIAALRLDQPEPALDMAIVLAGDAHPDGIAREQSGALWYADVEAGTVVKLDVHGRAAMRIRTGRAHAVSCAIGESEGETWLAIAVTDAMPSAVRTSEWAGAILAVPMASLAPGQAATPSSEQELWV